MQRLFFDTEFTDLTDDAKLISIGLVDESGKHTFYAELADTWASEDASEFVQEEVIPHLEGGAAGMPLQVLQERLAAWISSLQVAVILATDSLQWDWPWIKVLLQKHWPENLAREPLPLTMNYLCEFDAFEEALEAAFADGLRRHHALDDAKANQRAWRASGGDILGHFGT